MPVPPVSDADCSPAACNAELLTELGCRAFERCDNAAAFSENPVAITRTFCSPAMAQLHRALRGWMESAGMQCRVDPAGNLVGRFPAPHMARPSALVIGSHLDTVPNGGRYDGMLGTLLGVALVEAIARCAVQLPFAIDVVGFSEEEGVRFGMPYIGSRSMIGDCDQELLNRVDADGISVNAALRSFGCRPEEIASAELTPASAVAFLEAHIEQGPVLQSQNLPLGVVAAIAGQTRALIGFRGTSGHAGTVPMDLRRDALAAAAEWITGCENIARKTNGVVATVGAIEVVPNVANVIPGDARLRLDIRHADDTVRAAVLDELKCLGRELAARRSVEFHFSVSHEHDAVAMDQSVTAILEESLKDAGVKPTRLVSGAGHDAAVMGRRFPTAMLFIRCRDGISHHPDESVAVEDVVVALTAMWHFVHRLARRESVGAIGAQ